MPEIDLSKAGIPLAITLSALVMVGLGGVYLGRVLETNDFTRQELKSVSTQVSELKADINSLRLEIRPEDTWSKRDYLDFCWRAEKLNPGWNCPKSKKAEAHP